MSTEKPDVLEAAKQGNPRAIAALMNRSFESKGITIKAFLQNQCLSIFLESSQSLTPQPLIPFIRKGLTGLGITTIKTVKVYGRKQGSELPDWQQEFTLDTYNEPITSQVEVLKPAGTAIQPIASQKISSSRSTREPFSKTKMALIVLPSLAVMILLSIGGWLFWNRSAQETTLVKAQGLLSGVGEVETHSDLNALKTDQKQLQDNQKKLQDAIALLNSAPKLPVFNLNGLETERGKAQNQLSTVDQKLQTVDQQIKSLEQLLPVVRETVDRFSALSSGLKVGMNYRDYGQQVRELKVVLDRLERQSGATEHPAFKELSAAFEKYNFAYDVWQNYIESDATNNFFPTSSSYGAELMSEYGVTPRDIVGMSYIYLDDALSKVWDRATQHVKAAQKLV